MSNLFYQALCNNEHDANQLAQAVKKGIWPFETYLKNSISAFKDREVEANWQPLNEQTYELSEETKVFRIVPQTIVETISDDTGWYQINSDDIDKDFEPDLSDNLTIGKGKNRVLVSLNEHQVRQVNGHYEVHLLEHETALSDCDFSISWLGYPISLTPCQSKLTENANVQINGQSVVFELLKANQVRFSTLIEQGTDCIQINGLDTDYKIIEQFDQTQLPRAAKESNGRWVITTNEKLTIPNAKVVDITRHELDQILVADLQHNGKALSSGDFELATSQGKRLLKAKHNKAPKISKLTVTNSPLQISVKEQKTDKWIQLIEPDSDDDSGMSVLDYFFSDNATIIDKHGRKRNSYRVIKADSEEKRLLLSSKEGRQKESVYPREETLKAFADVAQLRKQQDAIQHLVTSPNFGNHGLLSLFVNRDDKHWPTLSHETADEAHWQILKDISFEGCAEQREFVEKALGSNDFAILDGPPGTGKTTAILELIVQLVQQGKRVLLTASTHAAINNVLERIDSNNLQNIVFPLRIGDEHNARGVEHYQFDNLLEGYSEDVGENLTKQLLVDSSNLICGTTIGLMRLFDDREIQLPDTGPAFDVMIIDECSKTPFQEFLVPARYAAKHILVGDIRQLSPFTDREQIVANLENLMLSPPRKGKAGTNLDKSVQTACFLLEELRGKNGQYLNQFVLPIPAKVCRVVKAEVNERRKLGDQAMDQVMVFDHLQFDSLQLWQSDVIFIDDNLLPKVVNQLPADAIVLSDDWVTEQHAFVNNQLFSVSQKWRDRKMELNTSGEIQQHLIRRLSSTSWAEELCWRLERLYWLRLASAYDEKTRVYKSTIERLLPKTEKTEGRVFQLQNIAFPSVLEALSGNGLQKRKQDEPHTLNRGFNGPEKADRHVTLTYQHRMHPAISKYPSKQFYNGESLKNGSKVSNNRNWDYQRYQVNGHAQHNIWLDVPKDTPKANVFKNANPAEVTQVIKELKAFSSWAKGKKNCDDEPYTAAVLTFYKGQEKALRKALNKLPGNSRKHSMFQIDDTPIKLATVDYFQGQEADIVLLSMVNNTRDGFLDSPNRLNVAITRARYQLVIIGDENYFANRSRTDELRGLARSTKTVKGSEL